ncbi:sodium-dependent bicarbonate transport family permease [Candidatus Methylopumilus universalis]|uniref:sodium-dependent bicarbonate transport family permease n=1 Tax=Candidatus Methylopumilus universalis TaxID=2588536 RepID=UPI00111F7FA2|nr:sodium-dependent bicarbonate transport family permease [Candidatus Methylopumilus universalis]QDC80785.1 sodium-dependent bicarbonate transport family permease [Candidatus Methylopumilus universalis]QDC82094.1 sodium-dependent bicarbonate transport family permease [Candidatus Methylopumilus universalis]QDC88528.1 sodium-dependent bicarbonate transport family permease [Candidatus Methylopumilus universalis]
MSNFLDPAILFFIFGVLAGFAKSNLEIPQPIARFLSLYLLMALGLKGGFALYESGITSEVLTSLGGAIFMAILVPLLGYLVLSQKLKKLDAAAVAATYGSISAVTFITASQNLDDLGIHYGGHMAAAMALMESPAIIFAIIIANKIRSHHQPESETRPTLGKIFHESFTDGGQLLLLGSMVIGITSGDVAHEVLAPFSIDLFKGILSFFLLDMGLHAARNISELKNKPAICFYYAVLGPITHAIVALVLAKLLGLELGNTILLMVLASSASYIAVPAVLRQALPEVSPALYMGMSLGLTFPLNIIFGIPLYTYLAQLWA